MGSGSATRPRMVVTYRFKENTGSLRTPIRARSKNAHLLLQARTRCPFMCRSEAPGSSILPRVAPRLSLLKVPDPKTSENRLKMDLWEGTPAERLGDGVRRGATACHRGSDCNWRAPAAPRGHPQPGRVHFLSCVTEMLYGARVFRCAASRTGYAPLEAAPVVQVVEQRRLVSGLEPLRHLFLAGKRGEPVELPDNSDRLHLIKAPVSSAGGCLLSRRATTAAPLGRGRRASYSRVERQLHETRVACTSWHARPFLEVA